MKCIVNLWLINGPMQVRWLAGLLVICRLVMIVVIWQGCWRIGTALIVFSYTGKIITVPD